MYKYAIRKGPESGIYDSLVGTIVGTYATYEEAFDQIPNGWVVDTETDADQGGEQWYGPDTEEDNMDGYSVLVSIVRVLDDQED